MTKVSNPIPPRPFVSRAPLLRRFLTCEDGATTTEFVVAAAFAVSLAVSIVLTTRDGAGVTAENTVVAMDQQRDEIDRLSDRQRQAMEDFANYKEGMSRSSEGGSVDDPYSNYETMPSSGAGGTAASGGAASGTGESESAEAGDTEQSSGDSETQTAAAENSAAETGSEATQTASSEEAATGGGSSGGGSNRNDDDDDDDDDDNDEDEFAQAEPETQKKCTKKRKKKGKC